MQFFLALYPDEALRFRHAPPSHAWLDACRRCSSPDILFAFFEDLAPRWKSADLANLLRKLQQLRGTHTRGDRVLLIVDGDAELPDNPVFIYLDRRPYAPGVPASIPRLRGGSSVAKHVICEHGRLLEPYQSLVAVSNVRESLWLPRATAIGDNCFSDDTLGLAHISMPVIASIGAAAFAGCTNLRSVSLVARDLGAHVFSGCTRLHTVSLPHARGASVGLFSGCQSLASVAMPVARRICRFAFRGCASITAIALPNVQRVDASAFVDCANLASVILPWLRRGHCIYGMSQSVVRRRGRARSRQEHASCLL